MLLYDRKEFYQMTGMPSGFLIMQALDGRVWVMGSCKTEHSAATRWQSFITAELLAPSRDCSMKHSVCILTCEFICHAQRQSVHDSRSCYRHATVAWQKEKKDCAFWCQFNEKPGCPGSWPGMHMHCKLKKDSTLQPSDVGICRAEASARRMGP